LLNISIARPGESAGKIEMPKVKIREKIYIPEIAYPGRDFESVDNPVNGRAVVFSSMQTALAPVDKFAEKCAREEAQKRGANRWRVRVEEREGEYRRAKDSPTEEEIQSKLESGW
jgi:hypothetical protein